MSKNTNTLKVIKRDGRIEDYNSSKITNAIIKAMMKVGKQDSFNDAFEITRNIEDVIFTNFENTIDITNIEKITENMLMMYDKDVAREYTSFRGARDASRMRSSNLVKKIKGLLTNTDVEITAENANKDSTKIYVQRDLLAGTVAKEITKDLKMIPPRVQNARYNNYLHWHDEDYSPLFDMYNCMLIDYRTMFNNNFVIGNAVVESPKSFGVACTLLSQIIQGVASSQYGGQTINRIDEGLAKYVTMSYAKIISDTINDIMALYGAMKRVSFDYSEGNTIVGINNKIRTGEYFNLFTDNYDKGIIDKISEETKNQITNAIIDRSMEKIEKCVYDGAQCLEYQINTLYSTNGQTP